MYKQRGFTLIELMITVLIVGILSIFGLQQYQIYIFKSKISEQFLWFDGLKPVIEEFYSSKGRFPVNFPELQMATTSKGSYAYLNDNPNGFFNDVYFAGTYWGYDMKHENRVLAYTNNSLPKTVEIIYHMVMNDQDQIIYICGTTDLNSIKYLPSNCQQILPANGISMYPYDNLKYGG